MISIARTFGAPDSVPAGRIERSASIGPTLGPQPPGHRGDDVHHVRVGLDGHERLDLDGAVLAHAPEVVAAEVDEHHVLGALLLVGEQVCGDRVVLARRRRRAGACRRSGACVTRPPRHGHERLGRGADDLEVLEVEEVHVRRRVDRPQPAVDRERLDGDRRRPALRGDDLEGVAGVHVLDDPRDHRLELLARHVRGRTRARRRRAPLQPRQRAGEPLADLARSARGARVAGLDARPPRRRRWRGS